MPPDQSPAYRSSDWFEAGALDGIGHRSTFRMQGFADEGYLGRPLIGILNSWSEAVGCNGHLRDLADHVKRGVLRAGGFPVEMPTISLGEPLMKPTTMLYRNLMAMAVEELISANPVDGVVLLAGCDKTVPAALMGAASANIPAVMVTGGPMLNGRWRGQELGTCTDCWRLHDELRAGRLTNEDWQDVESAMCRSVGHCSPMGTASTMACLVGGARHRTSRQRRDPGGGFPPSPRRRACRRAGSGSGGARTSTIGRHDGGGIPERHPDLARHRRIDERRDPLDRDRRTPRCSRRPRLV